MYTLINLSAAELMLWLFENIVPLLESPLKETFEHTRSDLRLIKLYCAVVNCFARPVLHYAALCRTFLCCVVLYCAPIYTVLHCAALCSTLLWFNLKQFMLLYCFLDYSIVQITTSEQTLVHIMCIISMESILSIPNAWFLSQWNTLPDTVVHCGIKMLTCTLTVHSVLLHFYTHNLG